MTSSVMCPSCRGLWPEEEFAKYRHNSTYHALCPSCKNHQFFRLITFLRACFFCGSSSGIVACPTHYDDGEATGRFDYTCLNCHAVEGDPELRRQQ